MTNDNHPLSIPYPPLPQVIFNGNGYDQASQQMLTDKGLCRIDSGVDAMCRYTVPKNIALFEEMKVTMMSSSLIIPLRRCSAAPPFQLYPSLNDLFFSSPL